MLTLCCQDHRTAPSSIDKSDPSETSPPTSRVQSSSAAEIIYKMDGKCWEKSLLVTGSEPPALHTEVWLVTGSFEHFYDPFLRRLGSRVFPVGDILT